MYSGTVCLAAQVLLSFRAHWFEWMLNFWKSWKWSPRTCSCFFVIRARTGDVLYGFGGGAFGRTSANTSAKTSEVTIYILQASRLGARAAVRVGLRPRLGSCLGLWGLCSVPRLCAWSCSCLCACLCVCVVACACLSLCAVCVCVSFCLSVSMCVCVCRRLLLRWPSQAARAWHSEIWGCKGGREMPRAGWDSLAGRDRRPAWDCWCSSTLIISNGEQEALGGPCFKSSGWFSSH